MLLNFIDKTFESAKRSLANESADPAQYRPEQTTFWHRPANQPPSQFALRALKQLVQRRDVIAG